MVDRPVSGSVQRVEDAKVAIFNETIDVAATETKGTVLLKNSEELINYTIGEEQMLEKVRLVQHTSQEGIH